MFSVRGTCKADVVIVFDSSASIGYWNWYALKQFVMDIIKKLKVSKSNTHISLVRFSNEVVVDMTLTDEFDPLLIRDFVWKRPFMAGTTNTQAALVAMLDVSQTTGRHGTVPQIGITVTDGKSNVFSHRTILRAQDAMVAGMQLIAVGK